MIDSSTAILGAFTLAGISVLVLITRLLDVAGTVTAILVGSIILFLGGLEWFALLLMFFFRHQLVYNYQLWFAPHKFD